MKEIKLVRKYVFYVPVNDVVLDEGWYYWRDMEPVGPYDTEDEALREYNKWLEVQRRDRGYL